MPHNERCAAIGAFFWVVRRLLQLPALRGTAAIVIAVMGAIAVIAIAAPVIARKRKKSKNNRCECEGRGKVQHGEIS